MLKASYSWRGNNIIRKRIPRINDTVTEKIVIASERISTRNCRSGVGYAVKI